MLLGLISVANSSAYYVSDVGTRSMARGGAFIAGADDTTAVYYNPAALTRIDGGQFKLDFAGVQQWITFDRADVGDEVFEPIENCLCPYPVPTIGLAQGFAGGRGALAFSVYPPYAPLIEYPADGPQRYDLVDSTVIEITAGPSAGFEVIPGLSIGAGLQYKWMLAGQELAITTLEGDDPSNDILFEMEARDPFTLSWNAGVLWEDPKDQRYAIGAAFVPPVTYEARGYLAADFSQHAFYESGQIVSESARDDDMLLTVKMPMQIKAGVLVRPTDALEIEAAGVYQKWDVVDEVVITDVDMEIDVDIFGTADTVEITDDVVLPAGYRNSWSARLGAEWDAGDRLSLRAGGIFETSAIPPATQGVNLVDGNKVGYGLGTTVHLNRRWAVDAAWTQNFLLLDEITDSEVRQIVVDPISGDISDGRVIGNGTMESRIDIASLAVQCLWGKGVWE